MKLRLSILHPKLNFRAHGDFDLPIKVVPQKGDVLDLSVIYVKLPQVNVESIYYQGPDPTEMACHLDSKISKSKCEKLFRYQDGWEVYG